MAKTQTYRAFVARPSHILDVNGELLDSALVLSSLAAEIRDISAYATFVVRNDVKLKDELSSITASAPAEAGRQAGIVMPVFLASGRTGRSRKEKLVQHNVITSYRSWHERVKAVNGDSFKCVSQGRKRTASAAAPSYGGDYVNLGAVDRQYAVIENDPFVDGEIVLKMVIRGAWYRLVFSFDNARFPCGKVTLPLIRVQNGQPVFSFTVVTDNPVVQFSGDWVVGVDVGINNYATVAVRNTKTGRIVYETMLSQRVHSLWNSIRASERQVKQLRKKADRLLCDRQGRMSALDEAQLHREAASRKKRELAILAAQEIADLSHVWGNAVVAVEDLSWISNTMQNGRWVVAVDAAYTSQQCHVCGQRVTHPRHKLSVCPEHGAMDRDVNAASNIATRAVSRVVKARVTRAKNRKLRPQVPLKTPPARASLKYPGRDRTKNVPTMKRRNHSRVSKEVILPLRPARVQASCLDARVLADGGTCGATGTSKAALEQGNVAYKSRLYSLI